MKKLFAALAAALALCLCFAAVSCAGNGGSEKGEWKLEFFGDGAQNYSVGDVYGGKTVEADYFECSFDGARYKVFREGDIVMEGRYSAENIGEDSLLLALETEGRRSLWNCGIRTENSGRQTLVITGEVDGLNVSFIEK